MYTLNDNTIADMIDTMLLAGARAADRHTERDLRKVCGKAGAGQHLRRIGIDPEAMRSV